VTVKQRLAALRQQLADLEWAGEDMNGPVAVRIAHEIEYLSGYERLGYEFEPNF
jgi:hypothetical protein